MFPCYIQAAIVEDVVGVPDEGYAPILFPDETPVTFLVEMTGFQLTRVLSALTNGAYLTYGDEGRQVIWDFMRWIEYPMPICEQIIACINGDEDTKQAFRDFFTGDPEIQQNIEDIAQNKVLSLENREKNILKQGECDPDFIFNEASVLVQLLHDLSEDMFEAIEVGTNQLERADILVGAIPAGGLNDTAATAFRLADQLAEEIQEEYMGAYDEAMYDTIRCAIFCACRDDCEMSIVKVMAIYAGLLNQEIPEDPIQALVFIMQFLATGDVPTDIVVYGMHFLMLSAIQAGTDLLGVDFGKLANRILAAGDEGNNDWELLCEDCNEPPPPDPACNDFTQEKYGWDILFEIGTYVSGQGFAPIADGPNYSLYVHKTAFAQGPIAKAVVKFNQPVTNIRYSHDNGTNSYMYTGDPVTDIEYSADTFPGWNNPNTNQGIFLFCYGGTGLTSSGRLVEVCLYTAEE